MDEFQPPPSNVQELPAADVMAQSPIGNVEYEAFPVRKPEEDLNDFKVQVRASTLTRCRTKLAKISNASFPWREIALGASTMATGAYLGALPADIPAGTRLSLLFNTAMPVLAVAGFVAFLFLRHAALSDPAQVASEVLSELPDPNRTR